MYSEIKYVKYGQAGSAIMVIGYIILLLSAIVSEKVEIQKLSGMKRWIRINPAAITAMSAWVRLIGLAILAYNNTAKLSNMTNESLQGKRKNLRPQLFITAGAWIFVIAIVVEIIGAQEDAEMAEPQIVIE